MNILYKIQYEKTIYNYINKYTKYGCVGPFHIFIETWVWCIRIGPTVLPMSFLFVL